MLLINAGCKCVSRIRAMTITVLKIKAQDFAGGPVVKNPPANAEDTGSIPGPRRSHMQQGPCTTNAEPMLSNKRSHRNEKTAP